MLDVFGSLGKAVVPKNTRVDFVYKCSYCGFENQIHITYEFLSDREKVKAAEETMKTYGWQADFVSERLKCPTCIERTKLISQDAVGNSISRSQK